MNGILILFLPPPPCLFTAAPFRRRATHLHPPSPSHTPSLICNDTIDTRARMPTG